MESNRSRLQTKVGSKRTLLSCPILQGKERHDKTASVSKQLKVKAYLRNGLATAALFYVFMGPAQAALFSFDLLSHPDGNALPPSYGLRLDGLFTGNGSDIWTFDFDDPSSNMTLTFDDIANTVAIAGQVFGGLDVNSVYDGTLQGLWDVDFVYQANVTSTAIPPDFSTGPFGIEVTADHASNMGSITPLFSAMDGGITITSGVAIELVDKDNGDFSFKFNNTDDHRLAGTGLMGPATYVGRGWLTHSGGPHISASDWLFIADPIPAVPIPAAIWLFASGLVGLGAVARRRRPNC